MGVAVRVLAAHDDGGEARQQPVGAGRDAQSADRFASAWADSERRGVAKDRRGSVKN